MRFVSTAWPAGGMSLATSRTTRSSLCGWAARQPPLVHPDRLAGRVEHSHEHVRPEHRARAEPGQPPRPRPVGRPLEERWWDGAAARRLHRLQLVTDDGAAWLLCFEDGGWWAEARYD